MTVVLVVVVTVVHAEKTPRSNFCKRKLTIFIAGFGFPKPVFIYFTVMKKTTSIILAAFIAAVSCSSSSSVEDRLQAYQDATNAIVEPYQTAVKALMEDTTLSDADKNAKIEEMSDKAESDILAVAKKAISKNADNAVAIAALKDVYYMMDEDELEKLIGTFSDENKQDEFVQKLLGGLNAKRTTKEGEKFVDFTVVQEPENAEASTVKFSDFVGNGKYVLVDFWASWCGPCKGEIPNIKAVYEKYAGEDFDVLSIAVWDKPADTVKAATEHGVVWSQIINAQQIPTDLYGIDGIPHIMLIGPDGTILKRNLRGEGIEAEVAKYVKAK